jgi:hypothetical protein
MLEISVSCAMMFSQHLDGDSYRFSWRMMAEILRDILVCSENWFLVSNFQKLRFFKKNNLRFVQPSNTN